MEIRTEKGEEISLREMLQKWGEIMPQPNHPLRVLGELGIEFQTAEETEERMTPKACWGNAAQMVMSDPARYVYMEGQVCIAGGIPIEHGWVYDRETKKHLEPTIRNAEMHKRVGPYCGLPFPIGFVMEVAEETGGYAGVLYMHSRAGELEKHLHRQYQQIKEETENA